MSETWMAEHNQPAVGRDGRVLYFYGAGLPTVVCAPLRVCMIELQSGEKLVGEPHIGDSVRWNLSPAMYGSGASTTSVIVLKPQGPGLDTNLLITTDRRAYYLRLLSKPDDYVARVAFAYPDDEENERKWQQHLAEQKDQQLKSSRIAELPPNAVDSMFFNYRLKGGDDNIRPVRVFDDGKKTYIQISEAARNRRMTQLLTVNEVATELRFSKSTVLRLLAGGIPNRPPLPAVRVGRRVMIRRETLDRFVQQAEGVNSSA